MAKSMVATRTDVVKKQYETMAKNNKTFRDQLGRGLTYTEKVLYNHLVTTDLKSIERGKSFVMLQPDRVAMQDATAQMAILQFIQSRRSRVAVPTTVHCDHLIQAHKGSVADTKMAEEVNREVYDFLKSASAKYGIGFWGPGSGIIHQVVLENYAYPGCLLIGTDSHTPNGGGVGAIAIGVGGADAVDVMAGMGWELLMPKICGIHLKGKLSGWASPKDVILKVLEILTVAGGTNKIVEYFGAGAEAISCTGKGTITNMGAELGATTSVFAFDQKIADFLRATKRGDLADLALQYASELRCDPEVEKNPGKYFDEIIEIDLDRLEPYIVGPHSPDKARSVSKFANEIDTEKYPENISACLIGSCTNSSYEDLYKASEIAKIAVKNGLKAKVPFMVSPGSSQIYATVKRDGILQSLEDFGGQILSNSCGPCIGQWKRDDIKMGERNSIVTSFNRNFRGRNDANNETLAFIASPEMVMAYAISGHLKFNPLKDNLPGTNIKLPAVTAPELPPKGFVEDTSGFFEPAADGSALTVNVSSTSDRLQILNPFLSWDGKNFENHLLLVKVLGKCTTDHISPAGKWLRFRGHLDHISDNMFSGATNAFRPQPDQKAFNQLDKTLGASLSDVARAYRKAGQRWIVVGDENYGEGSSREHAAMSPRLLGASAIIVKSFARIHETNLKKQGILAVTFRNVEDYDKIKEEDRFTFSDLTSFAPGKDLTVVVNKGKKGEWTFKAVHSYNAEQIQWFKAGSALNLLKGT